MDMMAKMVRSSGGAILNIDYGDKGPFSDSIRAIKSHRFVPGPHFWQIPGECDLSAHVPFGVLARHAYLWRDQAR
jgi:NADH dehydrogenase [ubiquinone] 1 alpha subcomplex assembly factor 7